MQKNEEHPVFADHLARALMTGEEYAAVQNYIQALKAAVLTGTKQYVILGAGMDTFAFREGEFLAKHQVFEVDHPLTQKKDKIERITRAGWSVPDNLTFVPVDFTKDNLAERLTASGFDPSAKSFFLMARCNLLPFHRSNRHNAGCTFRTLRGRQYTCV